MDTVLPSPISIKDLRPSCDPRSIGFKTTDDLEPLDTLIGQDRALGAIRFGTDIDRPGYNMFALGSQGTGRHTTVLSYLSEKAALSAAPDDWVYVHNFKSTHHPQALRLPAGVAIAFSASMEELVDDLRSSIPAIFQSDEYREKRRAIDNQFEEIQEKAFEELRKKAEAQNVAILRTPMGFALAPMHNGTVIKPEVFEVLPKEQRESMEAMIARLQQNLTAVLEKVPVIEKQQRSKIRELTAELTGIVVDASIGVVATKFADVDIIQQRLKEVRDDLIVNSELFTNTQPFDPASNFSPPAVAHIVDSQFNRYLVNVVVANDGDGDHKGAPLVTEDHPTLANIVGRIEHEAQYGALVTDFMMIRPGALHRANGGYLVLDARKVLFEMFSWEALKRALRGESVAIASAAEQLSLVSTISLEPEPIPLKIKVVLIGDRMLYYLLSTLDPEFSDLFKVEVDFDEEIVRSDSNIHLYARLIAAIAQKEKLRALDATGVARVVEEVSRQAEDSERLSLKIGRLSDLLGEADYWAAFANNQHITDVDVDRAIAEQVKRADRIRQRSQESIERGIILIETEGVAIGQVNALSVITLGSFSFGRPSRITARTRMGSGDIVDIERETKLGGPLHSKGVLILSSYLAAHFALATPISLWASIVFEQSYGGVDGDSASSAELYALLSSLADTPIKQSLAVTGSVNQFGQIQAIGGVNEKIEGFFDICQSRGLTGDQGVLIPASNVKHLMLRKDIVSAAADGKFSIYPIESINQGIELLTGIVAGDRQDDEKFPADTVYARVEAKLEHFATSRHRFGSNSDDSQSIRADT